MTLIYKVNRLQILQTKISNFSNLPIYLLIYNFRTSHFAVHWGEKNTPHAQNVGLFTDWIVKNKKNKTLTKNLEKKC